MPGLFINSTGEARTAGVYLVRISPPKIIEGAPNGYLGIAAQFAWGPHQVLYTPEDTQDFYRKFEPAGSPRTSTGYRALMRRQKLALKIVRVLGANSVAASGNLVGTGGNTVGTAKYHGVLGNSITLQQTAAASGDATKRDYIVTLTDAISGTTQEFYRDVPLPVGGNAVNVNVSSSLLLASLVLQGTMTVFPANGSVTLSSGSNGDAIVATDYTGTAGNADRGLARFEPDGDIRVICVDDCGNTLRSAINAALVAQAVAKTDRQAIVQGNPDAADWTAVKTDKGNYTNEFAFYVGAWITVLDDAGVAQTSPLATTIAAAIINLEPQESHAWHDDKVTDFYSMVQSIVANFDVTAETVTAQAFEQGIQLPKRLSTGRYAMQHDRNCNVAPEKRYGVTIRIAIYEGLALSRGLQSFTNGPNLDADNITMKGIVDEFLTREVAKGHIISFFTDIESVNNLTTLGLGEFYMKVEIRTPAPREKTFLLMKIGSTVTVTVQ